MVAAVHCSEMNILLFYQSSSLHLGLFYGLSVSTIVPFKDSLKTYSTSVYSSYSSVCRLAFAIHIFFIRIPNFFLSFSVLKSFAVLSLGLFLNYS